MSPLTLALYFLLTFAQRSGNQLRFILRLLSITVKWLYEDKLFQVEFSLPTR